MTGFKKHAGLGILLVSVMILAACGPKTTPEPTIDANMIYTAAAQTVQAQLTQAALLNPTATNTPEPTKTSQPTGTPGDVPTLPLPGNTTPGSIQITLPAFSTATLVPALVADKGEWAAQSPADNTEVSNNLDFDISWTIKNTGTTTWTTDYTYRYYAGDKFFQYSSYKLPKEVKPNESVTLLVDGKVPSSSGEKKTIWVLTNKDGANFYSFDMTLKFTGTAATAVNPTDLPISYLCCDNAPAGVAPSTTCQAWRDGQGFDYMLAACNDAGRPYHGPETTAP